MDQFLRQVLAFFFPRVEKAIDWSEGYTPRDLLLQKIIPSGEIGDRIADKLFVAKVKIKDENDQEVHDLRLYHAEVQGKKHQDFERRVYRYNYRAEDAEALPADSLVILADEDPLWRPTTYRFELEYTSMTFSFEPIKLLDFRGREEWLRKHENLVGLFTLAHLEAQRTTKDAQTRADVKLDLLLEMASRKLDEEDTRRWYAILDRLLYLDENIDLVVYDELARRSKEKGMEFVTRAEKIGLKKGQIEGLLSGLEALLEAKFAEAGLTLLPEAQKVEDPERLSKILQATRKATSLDDVRRAFAFVPPGSAAQP